MDEEKIEEEKMDKKMDEENLSNENNRKISGPFGNPANWHSSSSSSSSSTTETNLLPIAEELSEFQSGKFTIELMIVAHGKMKTRTFFEYGAKEVEKLYSNINICMFMFAPIGYDCWISPSRESYYRGVLVQNLKFFNRDQIGKETFGKMIVKAEEELDKKYSESDYIKIKSNKQYRSHTVDSNKNPYNKNFQFSDIDKNSKPGIFNLKTITFDNNFTIEANTNLLDLPLFNNFMNAAYNKYIRKYDNDHENEIYGYDVFLEDGFETYITLSEIITFFEMLNNEKEISGLNIFDVTCNSIDDPRSARRISREAHHSLNSKKQFGGKKDKKINFKYLSKSITKKNKRKRVNKLLKSRKLYKKGKYYTRKNVKSSRV